MRHQEHANHQEPASQSVDKESLAEQSPGDESRCELEYEDEQLLLQLQSVDALSRYESPCE
jgi:hypothetical protein